MSRWRISIITSPDIFSISITPRVDTKKTGIFGWHKGNCKRIQFIKMIRARVPQIISSSLQMDKGSRHQISNQNQRSADDPCQELSGDRKVPGDGRRGWVAKNELSCRSHRNKATANTRCSLTLSKIIFGLWISSVLLGLGSSV